MEMDRRAFLGESLIAGSMTLLARNLTLKEKSTENVSPGQEGRWVARILHADHPNGNNRIYPRAVLEKEIERFKKNPPGCMFGQLDMPPDCVTRIANISHSVNDLYMNGDYLMAEIEVLKTPSGKILKKLLKEAPHSVAFRTAGVGNGCMDEEGVLTINESYSMTGVHALSSDKAAAL